MTDQDKYLILQNAWNAVIPSGPDSSNSNSMEWDILFGFYNANRPKGTYPLSQNCRPCFSKVYLFVQEYIKKNFTIPQFFIHKGKISTTGIFSLDGQISVCTKQGDKITITGDMLWGLLRKGIDEMMAAGKDVVSGTLIPEKG